MNRLWPLTAWKYLKYHPLVLLKILLLIFKNLRP